MKKKKVYFIVLLFIFMTAMVVSSYSYAQESTSAAAFKPEELEQMLAPIALYPDSLLTQMLIASTYPLEIVQADRWVKQNKNKKGDELTKALESQPWDPSVKSLVKVPDVLAMMSSKLEWTQKVGNAFLAQQKDVMGTIQKLRAKAVASGNLKTTKEQVIKVEKEIIIIEPSNPQVVYVPVYNTTVVYGVWAYPAYPPPPVYVAPLGAAAVSFAAGVAVGAAWSGHHYHNDWHGGSINIDKDVNINRSGTRTSVRGTSAQQWNHNPQHRQGVPYQDQRTSQKYNRGTGGEAAKSRESYRGKGGQGSGSVSTQPAGAGSRQGTMDRGGKSGPSTQPAGNGSRQGAMDRGGKSGPSTMESQGKQSAFGGMDKGSNAKMQSDRGQSSRQNMAAPEKRGGGFGGGSSGGSRGGRRK